MIERAAARRACAPLHARALIVALLVPATGGAHAETMADIVRAVATGSPVVAQASARADAAGAAARAERGAARPQVSASATGLQGTRGANAEAGFDRTADADISLDFPIYNGGRSRSAIRAADAQAAEATAKLDVSRAGAVADAIRAYLDVVRDRAAVTLAQDNVGILERVVASASRRFDAGDGTRTDVAQARARLNLGRERVALAQAASLGSAARYTQLVGANPGVIERPPTLPAPPADTDAVMRTAHSRSPAVAAADAALRAARADAGKARADGRPQLSTSVSGQYHDYRQSDAGYPDERGAGARATISLTLPIYSGGRVAAEVRRARAGVEEASASRELAERQATADSRRALIDYRAQVAIIVVDEERVAAAREALTGVEAGERAGDRTVSDVLNAAVELLDAQVSLLNSRHDAYAAGVAVLTAVNRLDCFADPGDNACASAMTGA